jgi:hypothetical protein
MAEKEIPKVELECKHEIDFALIHKDIGLIQADIATIKDAIIGNGKPGIKTDIALLKSHSLRLYSWLAIITVFLLSIAGYALKG